MAKKTFIWIGIILVVGIFIFLLAKPGVNAYTALDSFEGEMKIYKASSCGCCGVYAGYFKREGNSNADIVELPDISFIKEQYNIPRSMESCHTTIIGDYFVEGHIPLEAVEKLLTEKPDIAGIAMPGMPNGSPGMPGAKKGDFIIFAVNHNGSIEEFMRI